MKKFKYLADTENGQSLFLDSKGHFKDLYKQDPMAASEFFINFLRGHKDKFDPKEFTLLQTAGYSALYEAGNCEKGCDFSAMGMELKQDDILAGIRSGAVNVNNIQDMSVAWGVNIDEEGNVSSVGLNKQERDFKGSVLGYAHHRGLFDGGRYIYGHEGETYILVPSAISGSRHTVDNPPEVMIRIKPTAGGKAEAHEDFHYHQMVSLFETMTDDNGAFNTDDCMGSPQCKGNLLLISDVISPLSASGYKKEYPDKSTAYKYIYGGYQMSIMEYPAWAVQNLVNSPTYGGSIK